MLETTAARTIRGTKLWEEALKAIEKEVSGQVFKAWFKRTEFVSFEGEVFTLEVPSKFFQDWLKARYLNLIVSALTPLCKIKVQVVFSVASTAAEEVSAPAVRNKKAIESPGGAPLNTRYTFDNFVAGESNYVAHAASLAVAESPAKAYNPFFIYGGVGLGKTHLMQAIGHFIQQKNKSARVCYISTETFINQWINSIRHQTTESFHGRYRAMDVLLVDDIHFLAGKETTQEQFFHTFNALHNAYKQIILSSDRAPGEMSALQERLVSRFEWGLVVDIQPPTLEMRVAILKRKEPCLTEEVAFFIADNVRTNIRKLEGALIRVVAHASLTGRPITLELAKEVLGGAGFGGDDQKEKISISSIQKEVVLFYGLRSADMQAKKRSKMIAFPRQVAMFLARELTDNSLPEIGEAFGRDHTTVIYAYEKIKKALREDVGLTRVVSQLKKKISS